MSAGTSAARSEPVIAQPSTLPQVPTGSEVRPARRRLHRFSLDQYQRMIDVGILSEHDPVVLIDGLWVRKMTKGDLHIAVTKRTVRALVRITPDGWHVTKEDPVALADGPEGYASVPEPDVMILRGDIDDYLHRKPVPADVTLIVEVAESSLRDDRKQLVSYAWSMIPFVWIVNLLARVVEVYSGPSGPGPDPRYQTTQTYGEDAEIPVIIDGREVGKVRVKDLIP
jgi:hypothetical protein